MLFLLITLIAADSLPPLPDLSKIVFPEPTLWLSPVPNHFSVGGLAGDFYGLDCGLKIARLELDAVYCKRNEWTQLEDYGTKGSYSLPLSRLWIKPAFGYYHQQSVEEYELFRPSAEYSVMLPWAVFFGNLNYDQWTINRGRFVEKTGKLALVFDKTTYLPHLEITGISTAGKTKTTFAGNLHINNLHFGIGTPVLDGFPSPVVSISYLEPSVKIRTFIKTGVVSQTLSQFFEPEKPFRYPAPVPDESLLVGAEAMTTFDWVDHRIDLRGRYYSWNTRLIAGPGYDFIMVHSLEEADFSVNLTNALVWKRLELRNSFIGQYNWASAAMPFFPRYLIEDTISLVCGILHVACRCQYTHKRTGINIRLPSVILFCPLVGIKYKFLELYATVFNIAGLRKEYYDGYFMSARQYAGGMKIDLTF